MNQTRNLARLLATSCVAGLALAASPSLAEEEEGRPARGPRDPQRMQRLLEEFDTDGDGQLSREERQAARERRMAEGGRGAERLKRIKERFDADGDGVLSDEERQAARAEMGRDGGRRGRRGPGAGRGGSERGGRGGMLRADPASLFDRIDEDGDGQVTKEQFVRFVESMRAQMQEQRAGRGGVGNRRGARDERPELN